MFEKLIQLLNSGKTYSQYELSEELGISLETLQSYIEYLHRKGLLSQIALEADNTTCSGSCSRCAGCKACTTKQSSVQMPVLWEIKDKIEIKS
ncbi:MAG: HTH domain-containing protein [Christensenellales bacterium]|jgi:biotin operon repressor|nr:HTH domain-containing protein [Christensenellaceae bacterium]